MLQFWTKPILPRGSIAVAVVYLKQSGYPLETSAKLRDLGIYEAARYRFTEVFDDLEIGILTPHENITCRVDPPAIVLMKAVPLNKRTMTDRKNNANINDLRYFEV